MQQKASGLESVNALGHFFYSQQKTIHKKNE